MLLSLPIRQIRQMATLKANGGAIRWYVHPGNGSRLVVCANARVLINPGGGNGWKRSRIKKSEILAHGFILDERKNQA